MKKERIHIHDIIEAWLKRRRKVSYYAMEMYLPSFGQRVFGQTHTPTSYARIFRKIKELNPQRFEEMDGKYKTWRVKAA